jgi:hypothetical protein
MFCILPNNIYIFIHFSWCGSDFANILAFTFSLRYEKLKTTTKMENTQSMSFPE